MGCRLTVGGATMVKMVSSTVEPQTLLAVKVMVYVPLFVNSQAGSNEAGVCGGILTAKGATGFIVHKYVGCTQVFKGKVKLSVLIISGAH
jgi:hypothetical protein